MSSASSAATLQPSQPPEHSPREFSFAEKLDKIQRCARGGLTEKILAQRERSEGEHKQVTVVFCDMDGFTPLTESLIPEQVHSLRDKDSRGRGV